jgi:hypothetical protein
MSRQQEDAEAAREGNPVSLDSGATATGLSQGTLFDHRREIQSSYFTSP